MSIENKAKAWKMVINMIISILTVACDASKATSFLPAPVR